jgi:PAS domain S-box-containing protein
MEKPSHEDILKKISLLEDEMAILKNKNLSCLEEIRLQNDQIRNLRAILDVTTHRTWMLTFKTHELFLSPHFYLMLGYEPYEFPVTYEMWLSLIHPDDIYKAKNITEKCLENDVERHDEEIRMRTKAGYYLWINSKVQMVERDERGEAVRIIGYYEDISERKSAEERLRWQLAMNMALAGLSGSIISHTYTIADIAAIVLEYSKMLTDSEIGYVSEIDPFTGDNIIHSFTNMLIKGYQIGGEVKRKIYPRLPDGTYPELWGRALNTKEFFYTNEPSLHDQSFGIPDMDAPIRRFLSVPVLLDSKLVGQITLANPQKDYMENDLVTVRRLASLYAIAINRFRSDEQLIISLQEKEVLLKELHHRVKNNMQVISSLLALQSRKIDDQKYRQLFQESQNRIHAMALIHEKLYHSKDISRVDFARYLLELTQHLFYSYSVNRQQIQLNIQVMNIYLSIDEAVPCAMIINELVSNSLKHAFSDDRKGEICISLVKRDDNRHVLTVKDDGIGIRQDVDLAKTESLGMQIVHSLTRQLKGSIDINDLNGTTVVISF